MVVDEDSCEGKSFPSINRHSQNVQGTNVAQTQVHTFDHSREMVHSKLFIAED